MSMIKCPECGKEISDKANSCPNCGCPRNQFFESENKTKNQEIYCPICHSRYIGIQGDIPLHKKIFEIGAFGNVTCITKSEYEKGMTFYCKKCDFYALRRHLFYRIPMQIHLEAPMKKRTGMAYQRHLL